MESCHESSNFFITTTPLIEQTNEQPFSKKSQSQRPVTSFANTQRRLMQSSCEIKLQCRKIKVRDNRIKVRKHSNNVTCDIVAIPEQIFKDSTSNLNYTNIVFDKESQRRHQQSVVEDSINKNFVLNPNINKKLKSKRLEDPDQVVKDIRKSIN